VRLDEVPTSAVPTLTANIWSALGWGLVDGRQIDVLESATMRQITQLFRAWEKDSGVKVADLAGLLDLIKDHGEAIEADLINVGMRLRDFPSERHNWRDLLVFVKFLGVESNLYADRYPDSAGWTRIALLLADIADSTGWLQWAKTKSAAEGGEPPDRIPRPGVKPPARRKGSRVKAMPLSKLKQLAGLDGERSERTQKLRKIFRSVK